MFMRYAFGLAATLGLVCSADAGVFRKSRQVNCTNGQCQTVQSGDTSSAAGAVNLIIMTGRFRHHGHPAGLYEGIGMSSHSPQAAIQNCCFWGKRVPVDIATGRLNNGQYIAVVRYR